jgi:hypothetical protein
MSSLVGLDKYQKNVSREIRGNHNDLHPNPNSRSWLERFVGYRHQTGNETIHAVGMMLIYSFEKHLNESFVFYDPSLMLHGSSKQHLSRDTVVSTSSVHIILILLLKLK